MSSAEITNQMFLVSSAKELGNYIVESEYNLIIDEFCSNRPANFQEFLNWVRGYMYYHAVYCACGGDSAQVVSYLEEAYDDLVNEYNNRDEVMDILVDEDEDYIMENIIEIEDPCPQW
jgi:hypothetical protein